MLELADVKTVFQKKSVLYSYNKKLSRVIEDIKETQIKLLKMSEGKTHLDGI